VRLSLGGAPAEVTFVASPQGLLPDESLWDLPRLVALLDSARKSIRVQVLTYKPAGRDGEPFDTLDAALRRAAARGVEVRLLVSDWNTRKGGLVGLLSLASVPHVQVNIETIPPWSGGDIPFARVVHAKYLAVDRARAWVGTSNWERDYFFQSRNVGLFVDSVPFAERLERFFDDGWNGPYVKPVAAFAAPAAAAVR
jgi:phosphatidylserine/phosphatidylglycerophosphate/cardiolipin synthase-like enzyme